MNILISRIFLKKIIRLFYLKFTSGYDFFLYIFKIPSYSISPILHSNQKLIVYLGSVLHTRIPRSIKYLKNQTNYYSVLLCFNDGFYAKFHNPYIDQTILFRNKWHLYRIFRSNKSIDLIHAFGPNSYYPALILKKKICPFIYDMQDILVCYYGTNPTKRWIKKELPYERYCLENSDGVIGYSLELNEGFRRYGIKKKPNVLFFPLYCDDEQLNVAPVKIDIKKEIHIVYVGGVAGSFREKKHYGSIQFFSLIESFTKQKIHFHIYPSPASLREDYIEYEKLTTNNSFFHLHSSVSQNELSKNLTAYHFGLVPFSMDHTQVSLEKYKYATSLKLFNYIEAGLPVIISKDLVYQSWIVQRYHCGIVISYPDLNILKEIIEKNDYIRLKNNLYENRKKISLQKNMFRMVDFYNKIGKFA